MRKRFQLLELNSNKNSNCLRAAVCKYRDSRDSCQNFDFLIFCLKDPFGELFSKIALKDSSDFYFSRNREMLKMAKSMRGAWPETL